MTKSITNAQPVSTRELNMAWVSIVSGILFAVLLGGLHLLEPEFDPTWRFVSEYALGSFGWLMPLAFVTLAISLASIGVTVFSRVRNIVGYIGLAVLALGVVGLLIAAIFRTDPITTKPENMTFSGQMHVLGASLDYSPVAFLLLSFSLARNHAWQPVRWWLFIAAGMTLLVTIGFIVMLPQDGLFGPGVFTGLVGRFLLVSYLGWIFTVAFHTLRLRRQDRSQ